MPGAMEKNNTAQEAKVNILPAEAGLSSEEAKGRIEEYGFNEIPERKRHALLRFLRYFWGPIPWMIEIALLLSGIIQHWEDFWIILVLLLLNCIVGFWQEQKADNAIELLKKKLANKARAMRDGIWIELPARELVPGDIVRLRFGDIVPADAKLSGAGYLQIDESILTGESLPIEKKESEMAYAGSIIRKGEMNAIVFATGLKSFFGKTVKTTAEIKISSHFQKAVTKIGDYLIILAIAIVAITALIGVFRQEAILDIVQFSLVLIVAAIPVALPAVLTVTMAVGAIALAKKGAIVSKLVSIEEMAGVDILFSDKTGTITKNALSVAQTSPFASFSEEEVIFYASIASRAEDNDPIDNAIIAKARTMNLLSDKKQDFKITGFSPFDPVTKKIEVEIKHSSGGKEMIAKGAPQAIIELIQEKERILPAINGIAFAFAEKGFRSLAVAKKKGDGKWQFVGLIALHDPPREDSKETIKKAQEIGLEIKIITGDHIAIAKEISSELALGTNILPATSLEGKSDGEATALVEGSDGFAEVFPEHKYRIVELMQKKGKIIAMTGDGVNDVPALKKADAGIAVAGATDAAKSAADIVFTRAGLSAIIDIIMESRKVFERMNSYATYRIAETIRILFFIALAIIVFGFYPVNALMIVLLAILNDVPIMMIAYDNTGLPKKPVHWEMKKLLTIATILGIIGVFSSFLLLWIGERILFLDMATIQTLIFLKLAVAGHLMIYLARTGEKNYLTKPLPALRLFAATETTQLAGTIIAVYGIFMAPIGWALAIFVWAYALLFFLATDIVKIKAYKMLDHGGITFAR